MSPRRADATAIPAWADMRRIGSGSSTSGRAERLDLGYVEAPPIGEVARHVAAGLDLLPRTPGGLGVAERSQGRGFDAAHVPENPGEVLHEHPCLGVARPRRRASRAAR